MIGILQNIFLFYNVIVVLGSYYDSDSRIKAWIPATMFMQTQHSKVLLTSSSSVTVRVRSWCKEIDLRRRRRSKRYPLPMHKSCKVWCQVRNCKAKISASSVIAGTEENFQHDSVDINNFFFIFLFILYIYFYELGKCLHSSQFHNVLFPSCVFTSGLNHEVQGAQCEGAFPLHLMSSYKLEIFLVQENWTLWCKLWNTFFSY